MFFKRFFKDSKSIEDITSGNQRGFGTDARDAGDYSYCSFLFNLFFCLEFEVRLLNLFGLIQKFSVGENKNYDVALKIINIRQQPYRLVPQKCKTWPHNLLKSAFHDQADF